MIQLTGNGEGQSGLGLWYHWGQIAIRHEAMASEIRRAADSWSDPELKAVMVSVAAAAFAVDGFSANIKKVVEPTDTTKNRSECENKKAPNQRARLRHLYLQGGNAKYYEAGAATCAVDVMLWLLGTCIRSPRSKFAAWVGESKSEELLHALENEWAAVATD